jgi:hypothetical protein
MSLSKNSKINMNFLIGPKLYQLTIYIRNGCHTKR